MGGGPFFCRNATSMPETTKPCPAHTGYLTISRVVKYNRFIPTDPFLRCLYPMKSHLPTGKPWAAQMPIDFQRINPDPVRVPRCAPLAHCRYSYHLTAGLKQHSAPEIPAKYPVTNRKKLHCNFMYLLSVLLLNKGTRNERRRL